MMHDSNKKLISICTPVLNEKDNINLFCESIFSVFNQVADSYDFEVIFTDNNSTDGTWEQILKAKEIYPQIRAYRFSRNIGFQQSILFNLTNARGSAAIQIDVDLQDSPELFLDFLNFWEDGYKIVYGKRVSRKEFILLRWFRQIGYKVIKLLSDEKIPEGAGDFRLIDREIIDIVKTIHNPEPYLRGFIASLGYKEIGIPYERKQRVNGVSKFNVFRLSQLGLSGLLNHSGIASKISGFVSILSLIISFFLSIYLAINRVTNSQLPTGWTFLSMLILVGIFLNSFLLWVLGHYINLIYRILIREPKILVMSEIGNSKA